MQRVIVRNALAALLYPGMMAFHVMHGFAPAHAQDTHAALSLAKVEAGQCDSDGTYTIVIHGGLAQLGGHHAARISFMKSLLREARSSLSSGARAIDVVEVVIADMEGSGLFNAGKGAVANQAGVVELDAAIMDGRNLKAGSVAAVTTLQNPISGARLVMDESEHVMLVGPNADNFVREKGGTITKNSYFLYGSQNFSDVPLPEDLAITPPGDAVSSEQSSFLGVWGGVSSAGDLNHILVVEKIEADSAKVIYALGQYPVWGDGLYRRLTGDFVENALTVIEPAELGGYTVIYRMNADDTLSLSATHPTLPDGETVMTRLPSMPDSDDKNGTVGAAVRDRCGDLAAGTSTGGYRSKTPGRVGDSPIIGAGTYADNETAAISAAGHGEFFMRHVVAYDITALMKYKGRSVKDAATSLIEQDLRIKGLRGGVIAVDRDGNHVMTYNSEGMVRGVTTDALEPAVAVY